MRIIRSNIVGHNPSLLLQWANMAKTMHFRKTPRHIGLANRIIEAAHITG